MLKKDFLFSLNQSQNCQIVDANGAELTCSDGRKLIDFSQMSIILGQGNPHFIETMTHALHGVTAGPAPIGGWKDQLYHRFETCSNGFFSAFHLTASGSESTEWAVKLARHMTGRSEVLSFWNSVHGRTQLSASMSGLPKRKTGYGPLSPGIVFTPYPDCCHCPFHQEQETCSHFCLQFLKEKVKFESAQDIAAVIIEPIQGSCVAVPPEDWLYELREWTRSNGILLIVDAIQTGMGRIGDIFSCNLHALDPDFLLLGKALGNGMHISAVLSKHQPPTDALEALSGGTGDDALCCAAACAVFDELLDHGLLNRILETGNYMEKSLRSLGGNITNVRGKGLLFGIDFPSSEKRSQALAAVYEAGYLATSAGELSMCFKPPYCITTEQIDILVNALRTTID